RRLPLCRAARSTACASPPPPVPQPSRRSRPRPTRQPARTAGDQGRPPAKRWRSRTARPAARPRPPRGLARAPLPLAWLVILERRRLPAGPLRVLLDQRFAQVCRGPVLIRLVGLDDLLHQPSALRAGSAARPLAPGVAPCAFAHWTFA